MSSPFSAEGLTCPGCGATDLHSVDDCCPHCGWKFSAPAQRGSSGANRVLMGVLIAMGLIGAVCLAAVIALFVICTATMNV
ncbi:hypothetical protein LCGC14_3145500 [marine sediment metagenome]|uniref:Uncharacterized protein n=1 Tax=marine sediment metagenome TaxID=412755 RepID=A0A0F8VVR7_9ZZZZ